ncbi:unnamed protein product, partial [Rotaria magnacalcarata]
VEDDDGNSASQFDKNDSIASNGFLIIFGRERVSGVELDADGYVDINFSLFDFDAINCFAFLMNFSSSCKYCVEHKVRGHLHKILFYA